MHPHSFDDTREVDWHIFSLETNGLVAVPPSLSWHWHGLLIGRSCLTHCSAICQKGTTKSLRLQLIWCGPVCCNRCRLETWNLLFYIDENSGQCKYAGGQPTDLSQARRIHTNHKWRRHSVSRPATYGQEELILSWRRVMLKDATDARSQVRSCLSFMGWESISPLLL